MSYANSKTSLIALLVVKPASPLDDVDARVARALGTALKGNTKAC